MLYAKFCSYTKKVNVSQKTQQQQKTFVGIHNIECIVEWITDMFYMKIQIQQQPNNPFASLMLVVWQPIYIQSE